MQAEFCSEIQANHSEAELDFVPAAAIFSK
jgi:hypothetical protein